LKRRPAGIRECALDGKRIAQEGPHPYNGREVPVSPVRLSRSFLVKTAAFILPVLAAAGIAAASGGLSGQEAEVRLAPGVSLKNVRDPFDYFSNSWAVIGLKDYPDATRISPLGEFLLGDKAVCRILVGEKLTPLDNRVRKTLEKGYLPVVGFDFVLNGTVEYEIEAFACPLPSFGQAGYNWPLDPNFLNLVRVSLRNRTGTPQTAAFGLGWKSPAPVSAGTLPFGNAWAVTAGDLFVGTIAASSGLRVTAAGDKLQVRTELPAGGSETAVLCLPYHALEKPGDSAALDLAQLDFDRWQARTCQFWENLLARGAQLDLPEGKVRESYLASLVYQFIGRDKGELHAGEGFYDEIYLRDGAYQAISLAQAGYLDEARESLGFFPYYQRENGQFLSHEGQLDANGYAVWGLVEYGLLTGDNAWLEKHSPRIEKALAFSRDARRTETDPDSPFFGVLPKAPADGENLWAGKNHILGYDWWNLRAVQSAAEAARRLGKSGDAATLESEFEEYRSAILRAIDRTGLPYLPPSYEKEGTHWGNLEAVFPTPLINPLDSRLTATLDFVRESFGKGEGARPGFIEGVMQWTPKTNAIHPYMSLFVTNTHIIRGEQDKAVDGFYSFLLHSTSSQGFPEGVYDQKREAWGGTVPHLWAAALYVTTLRNMLVREEGHDLHLLSAVPPGWLEPGKKIRFENVPTRFGAISLTMAAAKDVLVLRFTRPDRADPERVLIHLPPDFEVTGISRCGNGVKLSGVRDIFLPGTNLNDENEIRIGIRRKPGPPAKDFAARVAEFLSGSR
jgi:hypothetical protein